MNWSHTAEVLVDLQTRGMFTNVWLRWGRIFDWERNYCAYFSAINPAPSKPDIRKHPSKKLEFPESNVQYYLADKNLVHTKD